MSTELDDIELFDEYDNLNDYERLEEDKTDDNPPAKPEEDEEDTDLGDDLDTDLGDDNIEDDTDDTDKEPEVGEDDNEFADVLKENFNFLKEKGLLIVPDDYEFDGSEDKFEEALKVSFENQTNLVVENILSRIPEENRSVAEYILRGGTDFNTFKNTAEINYDNLKLEDENTRKLVLKEYYREKGFSDEKAEKHIKRAIDLGEDEEEAKEALEELKSIKKQKEDSLVKNLEEVEKARKQEELEAIQKLNKTLTEVNNIKGYDITPEDKAGFKRFISEKVKTKDGSISTRFDLSLEQYLTDPEKFILLSKFLMNDFEVAKKKPSAKQKEPQQDFYKKLRSRSKGSSRPSGGQSSGKPDTSILDGELEFDI